MARGGNDAPGGVLLLDKPPGPTSHDAVARARSAIGTRRVGHTGTLDPFASGLLVLCVGPATRLSEYFHLPPKTYRALVRLGEETETHDPEGRPTRTSDAWRGVTPERLEGALAAFRGPLRQLPPRYSAKSVDGRRAHRAARAGEDVELEARPVVVHELDLEEVDLPDVRVTCRVSTGTYVRALARDLGRELGCWAHLAELRRTAVGPYPVERALAWEELEEGKWRAAARGAPPAWISPGEALPWLPRRRLTEAEAEGVRHGQRVPRGDTEAPEAPLPDPPRVGVGGGTGDEDAGSEAAGAGEGAAPVLLLHGDALLAVAEPLGDELQPRKVWPDAA